VGLIVADDGSGKKLLVHDGKLAASTDCCGWCCNKCQSGVAAWRYQAVLAGAVKGDKTCDDCTGYNATYILPIAGFPVCQFSHTWFVPPLCSVDQNDLSLVFLQENGDYIARLGLAIYRYYPNWEIVRWQKNYGAVKPDCFHLSGEVLAFHQLIASDNQCDWSASTITLTALKKGA
jgi:hypothetical protein